MSDLDNKNTRKSVPLEVEKSGSIYKLFIPSEYLDIDAGPAERQFLSSCKQVLNEIVEGKRKAIILPSDVDDNGYRYFDLEVVEVTSE